MKYLIDQQLKNDLTYLISQSVFPNVKAGDLHSILARLEGLQAFDNSTTQDDTTENRNGPPDSD